MFDLINGLPVHPLVVHAVVVLIPLAVIGLIAIVVKPAWRLTYGWLVVAAAAIGTVLTPVATSSGEQLEQYVGDPGEHAELGETLIWFCIPLLLLTVAVVLLERRKASGRPVGGDSAKAIATGVAALAVVASLATAVQVYRIGDSGASAAWKDRVAGGKVAGDSD
ncbi:DUF2231 domain-containing protein [Nocardioides sp.]|uniref:DUF2231 domain-containing protein n=1 Tax=Nocardioides sp. TaxID=35761 RepID=UPI0035126B4B